ncbi:trypsin delta-like [Hermetia illucens]|uniref:trypsin delta-like n=1 Tax=Hermetia illucens TaxID=343691 RepID=UPI0018CC2D48|nr:trypsin delta-like [Hermetia illucens]
MYANITRSSLILLLISVIALIHGYPFNSHDDERIVGGAETTIDRFPYQISVRKSGRHSCGGSVLKLTVVISAAHCIAASGTLENLTVVAGTSYRAEVEEERKVQDVRIHPEYDINPTRNDLALLILDKALYFSKTIQPIELPNPGDTVRAGTKAIVTGWGDLTEGGSFSEQLQYVAVHIITNEECEAKYGEGKIYPNMICAGDDIGGKDACQGDSGGPLTVGGTLVGIVSWGYGCARPDYPGVYVRVANLRDWIDREVKKLGY